MGSFRILGVGRDTWYAGIGFVSHFWVVGRAVGVDFGFVSLFGAVGLVNLGSFRFFGLWGGNPPHFRAGVKYRGGTPSACV